MSEPEHTEPAAEAPAQILNDLDAERIKQALGNGSAASAARANVEQIVASYADVTSIFDRVLADLGLVDPPRTFALLNNAIGSMTGWLLSESGNDKALTRVRAFAIIDAVCDPHREHLTGKGYMFRVDPAYWGRAFGVTDVAIPAELCDCLNFVARTYRAAAMEIADMVKNDHTAIVVFKGVVEMLLAMLP